MMHARWSLAAWLLIGLATSTVAADRRPIQEGDVVAIRTAGQPERQVRVLRFAGGTDGIADVVDLATGARYSLPAPVVVSLPMVPPGEVRAALPPPPPVPQVSTMLGLPPAQRNDGWPAAGAAPNTTRFPTTQPTKSGTSGAARVQPPRPAATVWSSIPAAPATPSIAQTGATRPSHSPVPPVNSVRDLLRLESPPLALAKGIAAAPPVQPNPPPAMVPPTPPVRAEPQFAPTFTPAAPPPPPPPAPAPVAVPAPSPAVPTLPATQPTYAAPVAVSKPEPVDYANTTLPPTQPAYSTVVMPTMTIVAPEYEPVPVAEPVPDFSLTAKPTAPPTEPVFKAVAAPPEPAPVAPPPVMPTPVAPRVPALAPPTITATRIAPPPQPTPSFAVPRTPTPEFTTTPAPQVVQTAVTQTNPDLVSELLTGIHPTIAAEIRQPVHDLFHALRPSVRERAATAIAECRYGSRPEVKVILARAALLDPAPPVRAFCIQRLSLLGYHESTYLAYLDACTTSPHPEIRQSALDALAKLTRRN